MNRDNLTNRAVATEASCLAIERSLTGTYSFRFWSVRSTDPSGGHDAIIHWIFFNVIYSGMEPTTPAGGQSETHLDAAGSTRTTR